MDDYALSSFRFVEPSREDLEAELDRLMNGDGGDGLVADSIDDIQKSPQADIALDNIKEDGYMESNHLREDKPLEEELQKLSIVEEVKDPRELRRLALQAKQSGDIEKAKQYLLKAKEYESVPIKVDERINTVEDLVHVSPEDALRAKVIALKRSGNVQGALELLKQAKGKGKEQFDEDTQKQYKHISESLTKQVKSCIEAIKYYGERKNQEKLALFTARLKTAEEELKRLYADFKAKQQPPEYEQVNVEFETQEIDLTVPEGQLIVKINNQRLEPDMKLKIILECPLIGDPVKWIEAKSTQAVYPLKNDIRQIKFFEHRRCKFELVKVQTSFLFFSTETVIAFGHVKLFPLLTKCGLREKIRLTGQVNLTIDIEFKLRSPLTKRDVQLRKETFIFIPEYMLYGKCQYKEIITKSNNGDRSPDDLLISYNVIEKEIEKLQSKTKTDANAQLALIQLEGKRDALKLAVDTGSLQVEEYIDNLKACIVKCKQKCVEYKRLNQLDKAKELFLNIKIMQEEIDDAQANGNE